MVMNVISLVVSILALLISAVAFFYTFFSDVVSVSVGKLKYFDDKFENKTKVSFWFTNQGNSNLVIESAEYYSNGKVIPKSGYNSPVVNDLRDGLLVMPGNQMVLGNSLPLNSRADKLVIRLNHRVLRFSKTLTILDKEDNVKHA